MSDIGMMYVDDVCMMLLLSKKLWGVDGGELSTTSSDDDDVGDVCVNWMFVESMSV